MGGEGKCQLALPLGQDAHVLQAARVNLIDDIGHVTIFGTRISMDVDAVFRTECTAPRMRIGS